MTSHQYLFHKIKPIFSCDINWCLPSARQFWWCYARDATSDIISRPSRHRRRLTFDEAANDQQINHLAFVPEVSSTAGYDARCRRPQSEDGGLADLSRAHHSTKQTLNTHLKKNHPLITHGGSFERGNNNTSNITHAHLNKTSAGAFWDLRKDVSLFICFCGETPPVASRDIDAICSSAHANLAEKRQNCLPIYVF